METNSDSMGLRWKLRKLLWRYGPSAALSIVGFGLGMTGDGTLLYEFWISRVCFVLAASWHLFDRWQQWRHFPHPWTPNFKREIFLRTSFVLGLLIVALVWVGGKKTKAVASETHCTFSITSDIISRAHMRAKLDEQNNTQMIIPSFQELFYEWKATLKCDGQAENVSMELNHLREGDFASVQPVNAGAIFDNGKDSKVVALSFVSIDAPVTIVVRRNIVRPMLWADDLVAIANPRSSNCRLTAPVVVLAEAARLQERARRLSENVFRSAKDGVPLGIPKGPLAKEEVAAFIEIHCNDEQCTKMTGEQLTAELGMSPYQRDQEHTRKAMQSLKNDVEGVLGCISDPVADPHPTVEAFMIKSCFDGGVRLTPEIKQRLRDVFKKHNVKLDEAYRSLLEDPASSDYDDQLWQGIIGIAASDGGQSQ